jgi:hypothetical protein
MLQIRETNEIWEIAVEEPLQFVEDVKLETDPNLRGYYVDRPLVSLGKPNFWKLEQPSQRSARDIQEANEFYLARIAFSIKTKTDPIDEAKLSIELKSPMGTVTAFDMFPRAQVDEKITNMKLILSPELKFSNLIEASVAKFETSIENVRIVPVVDAFGVGESEPYWLFRNHKKHPLRGIRIVYLIIEKPYKASAVMKLEITAHLKTRKGIFKTWLDVQHEKVSWKF